MAQPPNRRPPSLPTIETAERGGSHDGASTTLNRRLFMQLLVFVAKSRAAQEQACTSLKQALQDEQLPCVLYADPNDPMALGLLTWDEDPGHFPTRVRPLFDHEHLRELRTKPGMTLLGRTYGSGYERDLLHWLLRRPIEHALHPDSTWALWYPLRRTGSFQALPPEEQAEVIREHASLGRAYGQAGHVRDLRLACHGIDQADNEFIIGLVGEQLQPLSHLIQSMRSTRQTAKYIDSMGPFFVGYVLFRQEGQVRPAKSP